MIRSSLYVAETPGPRVLILGAVHGDETCGTKALERIQTLFESGTWTLICGQLQVIPVCNPGAYKAGVRYLERNLNRYLVPQNVPTTYEARLGNILCPWLAACDTLLDLHSYDVVGGPPFLFLESGSAANRSLAQSLGITTAVTGWADAYAASGRAKPSNSESTDESTGTTEYARRFGARACTLECGHHADPHAPEVAFRAARSLLIAEGLLPPEVAANDPPLTPEPFRLVRVTRVVDQETPLGVFAKPWNHLDPIQKGEVLATRGDGTTICAPEDGFIILPKATAAPGDEWFYVGIETGLTTRNDPLHERS